MEKWIQGLLQRVGDPNHNFRHSDIRGLIEEIHQLEVRNAKMEKVIIVAQTLWEGHCSYYEESKQGGAIDELGEALKELKETIG